MSASLMNCIKGVRLFFSTVTDGGGKQNVCLGLLSFVGFRLRRWGSFWCGEKMESESELVLKHCCSSKPKRTQTLSMLQHLRLSLLDVVDEKP